MKLYIEQKNGSKFFIEDVTLCEASEPEDTPPEFIQKKIEENDNQPN